MVSSTQPPLSPLKYMRKGGRVRVKEAYAMMESERRGRERDRTEAEKVGGAAL